MARKQCLCSIGRANRLDVARVLVHFAFAHLEGSDVRKPRELRKQFRRIRTPRPRRVNMHDQGQATSLADRGEVFDAMIRPESKAQPVMRRHDIEAGGPCFLCPSRLFNRVIDAFAYDRGDHGANLLIGIGDDARHLRPLARRQREHFAGMAIRHQCSDPGLTSEPLRQPTQLWVVDAVVGSERHCYRWNDALEVDRSHEPSPHSDNTHVTPTGMDPICVHRSARWRLNAAHRSRRCVPPMNAADVFRFLYY